MPQGFYRYIANPRELEQLTRDKTLQSVNPTTNYATWYTPTRYDDPSTAQAELALSRPPIHRIGPMPASNMPDLYVTYRTIEPAYGQPGGGIEVCVLDPLHLFGVWDLSAKQWGNV